MQKYFRPKFLFLSTEKKQSYHASTIVPKDELRIMETNHVETVQHKTKLDILADMSKTQLDALADIACILIALAKEENYNARVHEEYVQFIRAYFVRQRRL